jgi:acetolactate synthase-1/2/3 large subunit
MADALGQIERRPGICLATLGPGAMNLALGVANAYLDHSPMIAITATLPRSMAPYATHQNLDLNAVYRPFTKATWTLDGHDTAATIRRAWRLALEPRPGPVHLALAGDVARMQDQVTVGATAVDMRVPPIGPPSPDDLERVADRLARARRPVVILGLDLAPYAPNPALRAFIEKLNVPVFVAPKAKGAIPEDHPLFFGVCAGVAADHVIIDFFRQADLLVGIGYDPMESNRIWHQALPLISIGPLSIAADQFRPQAECAGDLQTTLAALQARTFGPYEWTAADLAGFRAQMMATLRPMVPSPCGLSPFEVTCRLRELVPRDAIVTTDVGAVKFITSQCFTTWEPMTFLQSNGLSSMGFAFPGAMAARLAHPDRTVVCTVGDGGFGMSLGDVETCVRERLPFLTIVYNDRQLSLIKVIQQNKHLPVCGVEYGAIDFAAAARAMGAIGVRASTMAEFDAAVRQGLAADRLTVVDVQIDPTEYLSQTKPCGL